MLRKAGLYEQFHFTRHSLNLDSCVVAAAQYTSSSDLVLTRDVLYPALKRVIQQHAALGVYSVDSAINSSAFTKLDAIDLDKNVEFITGRDLATVLSEQMATGFDTKAELPLWRVVVIDIKLVVFAWHHAIGDGMSGLAFHKSLLQSLAGAEEGVNSTATPSTSELAPALENAMNISPSMFTVLKEIISMFLPASWKADFSAWTGLPVGTTPSPTADVRIIQIPTADFTRFHAACRAHKATVTPALSAITVAAISQTLLDSKTTTQTQSQFKTLCASTPISLRAPSHASNDVFCDYVTGYTTYPLIDPAFSWAKAAEVTADLHRQKNSAGSVGLLKFLGGNYSGFFGGKLGGKRGGTFEVSNPGVFRPTIESKDVSSGRWAVEDMWFAQCDAYVGSALKINVVGVAGGGLSVVVTSGKDALGEGQLDTFVANFIRIIEENSV